MLGILFSLERSLSSGLKRPRERHVMPRIKMEESASAHESMLETKEDLAFAVG